MRKYIAIVAMLACASMASADELSDGVKAWEQQDFARAHQIFSKLAGGGNSEAQLLLGEMYGFGEGAPEDMAKAEYWLKQAQANGNKDAAASLDTLAQRSAHKADIARHMSAYDGADVKFEKFGCVKPLIPEVSKSQSDIKAVRAGVQAWIECYGRFVKNLGEALPAAKVIPADIAKLMSVGELSQAGASMDKVRAEIGRAAHQQALELIAANDAWAKQTEAFTVASNTINVQQQAQRQREIDKINERLRAIMGKP